MLLTFPMFCILNNSYGQIEYLPAIQAAFGGGSFISGLIQAGNEQKWDQKTSDQLDAILNNTKAILDDLQKLNLNLKITVHGEFVDFAGKSLVSDGKVFVDNLDNVKAYKKKHNPLIHQLLFKVEGDTHMVSEYGVESYQTLFAGILVTKTLFDFTGLADLNDQKRYFQGFDAVFSEWLKPNEGNPSYLLAQEQTNRDNDVAEINAIIANGSTFAGIIYYVQQGPRGLHGGPPDFSDVSCNYSGTFSIVGSLEKGFTVSIASFTTPCPGRLSKRYNSEADSKRQATQNSLNNAWNDYQSRLEKINELQVIQNQLTHYEAFIHKYS
jgi:hypothetical protein